MSTAHEAMVERLLRHLEHMNPDKNVRGLAPKEVCLNEPGHVGARFVDVGWTVVAKWSEALDLTLYDIHGSTFENAECVPVAWIEWRDGVLFDEHGTQLVTGHLGRDLLRKLIGIIEAA